MNLCQAWYAEKKDNPGKKMDPAARQALAQAAGGTDRIPDYCATVPFTQGIRQTIAWFDADPSRRVVDEEANAVWDRLIAACGGTKP